MGRVSASWDLIEPREGQFDFRGLDQRILAMQNLGIQPFVTFESTADWATNPATQKVKNARPTDMALWARFIRTVVARYNGDGQGDIPGLRFPVRYWQAANEWISTTNGSGGWAGTTPELIDYIRAARDAVKSQAPQSTFVLGGLAAFNSDILLVARANASMTVRQKWSRSSETVLTPTEMRGPEIRAIIDSRVLPVLRQAPYDVASVHLYGPESRDLARLDFLRRTTGKPILSSECGGPSLDYGGEYSDAAHFQAVIERNLNVLSSGAQFCLWFRLGESGGSTFGNRRTPLYDTRARAKPGVFAYRALARLIDANARISVEGPGNYTIARAGGQRISVAWGPAATALRNGGGEILCLSDAGDGRLSSDLSRCPATAMTFAGRGLTSLLAP